MKPEFDLPIDAELAHRRTTPDRVVDTLREGILSGALRDGEELNQVALAEYFNVSRVPIREALRQLQAEGLVRQKAHRRAVVSALGIEHILELFDLRTLLETYLLSRAMPNITADDVATLAGLLEQLDAATDRRQWLELNRRYHHSMYTPAGASYTLELADNIAARTSRYLYIYSGGQGIDRISAAADEHRRLLRAVSEGDTDSACELLREHIQRTRADVERLYAERAAADEPEQANHGASSPRREGGL